MNAPDDHKNVSLRLGADTMLRLAMSAHEKGVTLNDLVVAIMSDFIYRYVQRIVPSRNKREGYYMGKYAGRHKRGWAFRLHA